MAALREGTGLIVQLSTGGAVTDSFAHRLAVLDAAPDACSLTCGTVNFGDDVFINPWPFIRELYQLTQERQVVPEFELFDLGPRGDPAPAARLSSARLPAGTCTATWSWACPAACRGTWPRWPPRWPRCRAGATWSATGIGRTTLPVLFGALGAGGHLRVGMEDTLTYARAARWPATPNWSSGPPSLARLAQRPPMPPAGARAFLAPAPAPRPGPRQVLADGSQLQAPGGRLKGCVTRP